MFSLLAKLFIKNYDALERPSVRLKYGMLSGMLGIALNVLLFAGKYIAGTLAGSIAITADAFNNLSDAGSSLITFLGFRFAGMKADDEHPFGHGRFEYISALMVSMIIIIMGFELGKSSVAKIITPEPVSTGALTAVILAVSICVKLYMFFYNSRYGKRLESDAMRATAADSLSDVVATTVVLLSAGAAHLFRVNLDGWCGVIVALFILYTGVSTIKDTLASLLGKPPTHEFVSEIRDIALSHSVVLGIHDLVVHDYGPGRRLVSMHCEVPSNGDLIVMHDAIDHIERELEEKLGCEAVIHMDPLDTDDTALTSVRERVEGIISEMDSSIQIHDFRMVSGPTHTNLIFDVLVPHKYPMTDGELTAEIKRRVRELDNTYYCVIKVDKSYI